MDFIFDPSLVFYLPLHELDGASFMSKDKHGHLATVTGAVWTPRGRSFDGIDDIINLGNSSLFNFTSGDFSILLWVKPGTITDTDYELFNRGVVNTDGYRFFHRNGGFQFWTHQVGAAQQTTSNLGLVSVDVWSLLGMSRSGNSVRLYHNNIDVTNVAGSHTDPLTNTRDTFLGTYGDGASAPYAGLIGEVLGYDRVVTPLEIQRIYLSTRWRYQ